VPLYHPKEIFCKLILNRHIESIEQVVGVLAAIDLVLICGDYNLTIFEWSMHGDDLCPSNVMTARESILVNGMATCGRPKWCSG
jgi:hypothetical protein